MNGRILLEGVLLEQQIPANPSANVEQGSSSSLTCSFFFLYSVFLFSLVLLLAWEAIGKKETFRMKRRNTGHVLFLRLGTFSLVATLKPSFISRYLVFRSFILCISFKFTLTFYCS